MLALYRAGRQADALETYRDARRRFVDELGIEPGPELQRLEHAVLAHDPELDAPPAVRARAPDAAPRENLAPDDRASGLGARPVRLFEREASCRCSIAPSSAPRAGRGAGVRRGSGRDRQVAAHCRSAATGGRRRAARAVGPRRRAGRDFPFGVVRQLCEPRLADEAVRERVLSGAAGPPPRSSACRACR